MKSLTNPNRQVQARARSAPGKQQPTKDKGGKKVVEFAVLKSAGEEQENMKWDPVTANGMLPSINENDNEEAISNLLKSPFQTSFQ